MSVRVINADVMDGLAQIADDSVHCVVTSPPYWQLRDYGFDGQIGLEPTVEAHVAKMVEVFREVRRVLRPDGVMMFNYGDMWANDDKWGGSSGGKHAKGLHGESGVGRRKRESGLKPKDLVLMPHRIAIALQADGWWVRDDIVWHKPNPMLSSVTDRCTPAKEYVFQMTKRGRYFWDAVAIEEPRTSNEDSNGFRGGSYVGGSPGPRTTRGNVRIKVPGGWDTGKGGHGTLHRNGRTVGQYVEARPPGTAPHSGLHRKNEQSDDRQRNGFNDRWDAAEHAGSSITRNRRNVWTIATEPYKDAHFATMPTRLAELCILAATSAKGCCAACGAPWQRVSETTYENPGNRTTNGARSIENREHTAGFAQRLEKRVETKGWRPTCRCGDASPVVPCTVLDPFGGAGTTGLVADRLQRHAVLIEGSPEYAERHIKVRIASDRSELLNLMESDA